MSEVRDYRAETAAPKVGNRVRIVIEGEVDLIDSAGWLSVMDSWHPPVGPEGSVSIEVIHEPFKLPTKRYAQVQVGDRYYWWTRKYLDTEHGVGHSQWVDPHGNPISSENLLMLSGLRVISEGVDDE